MVLSWLVIIYNLISVLVCFWDITVTVSVCFGCKIQFKGRHFIEDVKTKIGKKCVFLACR